MIRKIVFTVAFICFCIDHAAYGETGSEKNRCDKSTVNLVGKYLGVSNFSYPKVNMYPRDKNGSVIVTGVCKVWPKDNSKIIAIFAYDEGVKYEKRLIVVLVDTIKVRIVASYKGAIKEDAGIVGEDSFRIDTARYDLAPGIRAFGLDVVTDNSFNGEACGDGCADDGYGPVRTLFVQDGKEIKPILEGFYTSSWSYALYSTYEGRSYSLSVDTASTNGYKDLLVTETLSDRDGKKIGKPLRYKLRYDGKKYHK